MKLKQSIGFRFGKNDKKIQKFISKQKNISFTIKLSINIILELFGDKDLKYLEDIFLNSGVKGVLNKIK